MRRRMLMSKNGGNSETYPIPDGWKMVYNGNGNFIRSSVIDSIFIDPRLYFTENQNLYINTTKIELIINGESLGSGIVRYGLNGNNIPSCYVNTYKNPGTTNDDNTDTFDNFNFSMILSGTFNSDKTEINSSSVNIFLPIRYADYVGSVDVKILRTKDK